MEASVECGAQTVQEGEELGGEGVMLGTVAAGRGVFVYGSHSLSRSYGRTHRHAHPPHTFACGQAHAHTHTHTHTYTHTHAHTQTADMGSVFTGATKCAIVSQSS
jgi:hypothetical protein